jgi:acyl-CoA reductase-like NAD-dependent aldehyde dehydrogenase
MSYEQRLAKVLQLAGVLEHNRDKIVDFAVKDLNFTVKDSLKEVEIAVDRLHMFREADFLMNRRPIGGTDSRVSLMLSYNGSAWLNTAITSIYIVGNKVGVKFSSKAKNLMALTESMYRPIFGDDVTFYKESGRRFVEDALNDPAIPALVIFGSDDNVLPYEEAFRRTGKKMVFEGPGQDPFIVFPDADFDIALEDLMAGKFMYSGQTCTAPKRIFVHESICDEFLGQFVERARELVVGQPTDGRTDVSPVASDLAVSRIHTQLQDAAAKGAQVLIGGTIDGNLIQPTIVKNCTDDMLGMQEEVFGPVAFTSSFTTAEEVIRRSQNHKYGLRAAVYGGGSARRVACALSGEDYCHPVSDYTFGKFGTVAYNETRATSWRGAFVTKAVGGYGYSGWIWETVEGQFRMKQGPKLLSVETSVAA